MTHPGHILIVEDESKLAAVLRDYLLAAGYQVTVQDTGDDAVQWIADHGPQLVILDIMVPGSKDGLAILREVRAFSPVPVIMTTAQVEEIDRLLGLELGADDYICKPYSPREVLARVKAVLRRVQPMADAPAAADNRAITLHPDRLRVSRGANEVALTSVEFEMLRAMYDSEGRIFARDALMNRIYPDHRVVSDRTIDSHVKKLRRKLQTLVPEQELIHSVYGVGYRYEEVGR